MTILLKPHLYIRNRDNVRSERPLTMGNEKSHDMLHNCLTCLKWSVCRDSQKSARYRCSNYREATIEATDISTLMSSGEDWSDMNHSTELTEEELQALIKKGDEEDSITDMIEKVISSNIPIPPDLRINDSIIPTAKNLMQWTTDRMFSGGMQTPFPRQLEIGTKLYGEWCVAKGTRVPTNKGLVKIEDINDEVGLNPVSGWNVLSREGYQSVTHAGKMSSKKQECIKIHTDYSKSLVVTPEHRVLVNREGWSLEWVHAQDLREGDYLVKPYADDCFARDWPLLPQISDITWLNKRNVTDISQLIYPTHMTPEICFMLGALMGDGAIESNRIGFIASNKGVYSQVKRGMAQITNMPGNGKTYTPKNGTKQIWEIGFSSIHLLSYFGAMGISPATCSNKSIPELIYSCPKEGIVQFLKGLLETDGSIRGTITLGMTSKKLVQGAAELFQYLGIYGKVDSYVPLRDDGTPYKRKWEWICYDPVYLAKIKDVFGHFKTKTPADFTEVSDINPRETKRQSATKPGTVRNIRYMKTLLNERISYHVSKYKGFPRCSQMYANQVGPQIIEMYGDDVLKKHSLGALETWNGKYSFFKVTKIAKTKPRYVYDLTVPVSESFVANGYIVHNCVRCSDADWFDEMPVDAPLSEIQDRVVFLEHGKCPKCKVLRNTLIAKKEMDDYFSLVLLAGQRSAKTTSAIMWESYNTHRVLKLPNPAGVYGLLPSTPIYSTYTALTFGQAVENVWVFFKNILKDYPWYKLYHKFLDEKGHELGEELYTLSEVFVRYRHRNYFISPSSPSKRVMRGRTRLTALVDELGWFPIARKSGKQTPGGENNFERLDAKGVMDALLASMFTIRNAYNQRLREGFHVPKPIFMTASSPQAYNDAIMTIYRESMPHKHILTLKYPTWEYNPTVKRSDLDPDYEANPVHAARNFGCEPPLGEGLFINDMVAAEKVFSKKAINPYQVSTFKGLSKTGKKITTSSLKMVSSSQPDYPTILSIDLGITNNSLSFSIVGLPNDYDEDLAPEDRGTHLNPVQVFGVGEIIPRDGTRISLTHWYTNCILPLVDHYNVSYLISDRWQNAKIMSDLEQSHSVEPIEWKCTWEDFEQFRELVYTGNIRFPKLENPGSKILETTLDNYPECFRKNPIDHLFFQLATVIESTNVTVLKGDGTTDDSFRTAVLGSALMQDPEVFDYIITNRVGYSRPTSAPIGIVVKSQGGAGTMSLSSNSKGIGALVKGRG